MKLINEKGRLLGIINVVDLAVLIVLLLVAFAAVVKLSGGEIKAPISAKRTATIVSRAQARAYNLFDTFKKGDQLMYGNILIEGAFIENVEVKPNMVNIPLPSGQIVQAEDPELKDIYFTITASVDMDAAVKKVGDTVLRVGNTFNIYTKNAQTGSMIMSIEYEK